MIILFLVNHHGDFAFARRAFIEIRAFLNIGNIRHHEFFHDPAISAVARIKRVPVPVQRTGLREKLAAVVAVIFAAHVDKLGIAHVHCVCIAIHGFVNRGIAPCIRFIRRLVPVCGSAWAIRVLLTKQRPFDRQCFTRFACGWIHTQACRRRFFCGVRGGVTTPLLLLLSSSR
jgi:hypothetical protein